MSASCTDNNASTTHKHTQPTVPNLRDLLSQHEAEPVNGSCAKQNIHHEQAHQGISSGTSLAQLMSQHEQKSKTGVADSGRSLNISSLSTLAADSNSSWSSLSNQNSLSLGTLASLKISPPADTSTPSILSTSLSNLSLNNPSIASSALAYPGFGSLTSVLHNSQLSVSVPKAGPSLADLIQTHSNHSEASSSSLLTAGGGIASVKCAAAAHTPSLSELVSQHQNGRIPPQSTDKAANRASSSNVASLTPSFLGGTVSLSELALQHQTSSSFTSRQPDSTESQADALKRPPGLCKLLSLSQLTSEHKGKPSATSNGSHCTLTSLPLPAKPEGAGMLAESTTRGGAKRELDHKPFQQISRPSKPGHTIDLSVLMAQASGDLPSPSSPTHLAPGQGSSVFAKPSVFAVTLSFQSHSQQKRRNKHPMKGKLKVPKTESVYQMCSSNLQDKSKEHDFSIVPFRFDSPSPDDIVRANQKKAFTR